MVIDLLSEAAVEEEHEETRLLKETGALLFGDFVLASGKSSSYYFDSKKLTLDPAGAMLVARRIVGKLDELGICSVGGTAYGAIPIVSHVVLFSGLREGPAIRAFYHRKEAKEHGTQALAEGQFPTGAEPVAILEDVVTSGDSLLQAIEMAKREGYNVTHAMTLVDRDEGGREAVEAAGCQFWSLFKVERSGDEVTFIYNGR